MPQKVFNLEYKHLRPQSPWLFVWTFGRSEMQSSMGISDVEN